MNSLFIIVALISFVVVAVSLVRGIVAFFKKDRQKAKKQFKLYFASIAIAIVSLIAFGMTSDSSETSEGDKETIETASSGKDGKLEFTIQEERVNGSVWYVTLLTPLTEEDDLRRLVESTSDLAKTKKEKIDSVFVKVNIKDSLAKSYAADGKAGFTTKGLIQTGMDKINEYEFNYNVKKEHLTTKADLKQSTESYSADDILKAFQDAGLPTTDARDNSHNCIDLDCTALITTEDVSIYEWYSVEKAIEISNKGFGGAQVGTIIIRLNNKTLDIQKYIDVLNKEINI